MRDDRCDLLCLDLPRAESIRQHLNEDAIAQTAAGAKALGDPMRMKLAVALRAGGELCVCDLAWITGRPAWQGSLRARRQRRVLSQRDRRVARVPAMAQGQETTIRCRWI